jgi:hypothetical protein
VLYCGATRCADKLDFGQPQAYQVHATLVGHCHHMVQFPVPRLAQPSNCHQARAGFGCQVACLHLAIVTDAQRSCLQPLLVFFFLFIFQAGCQRLACNIRAPLECNGYQRLLIYDCRVSRWPFRFFVCASKTISTLIALLVMASLRCVTGHFRRLRETTKLVSTCIAFEKGATIGGVLRSGICRSMGCAALSQWSVLNPF